MMVEVDDTQGTSLPAGFVECFSWIELNCRTPRAEDLAEKENEQPPTAQPISLPRPFTAG